jgi:hypothetical protein
MSSIKIVHSGGNSVSITAPDNNPASNRTLKLPSSADGTITTYNSSGNIEIPTVDKGIDLSIQDISAGITTSAFVNASRTGTISSEIFNHYETGTFIPDLLYVAQPTYNSRTGRYTRIGNLVYVQIKLDISSLPSDGSGFTIGGIPYTSAQQATNGQEVVLYSLGRFTSLLGSKATAVTNVRFVNKGTTPPPSAELNYTGGLQLLEGNDSKITYNEVASSGILCLAAQYMVIGY